MVCVDPAPTSVLRDRWPWHAARRVVWLLAGILSALPALAQTPPVVDVQARRNGDLIDVSAVAIVNASMAVVWGTLTDYERLPEFIPGLETSRIIARKGSSVTVAQTGQARFLFLTLPISVTLESTERPPHIVEVRRVAGTLRHLQGRYEATPMAAKQVQLRWIGRVSPEADLPPLIGTTLARLSIQDQFEGMVREIERRAGFLRQTAVPPGSLR